VMNQQREVIYSLRSFALEGGEELKGEALRMIEKAVSARVEAVLAEYESEVEWDYDLLRQDLLMHYMLRVHELENSDLRPTELPAVQTVTVAAAREAFDRKLASLDSVRDENGEGYGDRLLSLVMLNVLDEKWKDHLYDLDQLRNAIHYRSWGQKDPLVEYKQEAYSMFVDLMSDIYNTFTDRFLKVQLQFGPPPEPPQDGDGQGPRGGRPRGSRPPVKRYNAMGILEEEPGNDVPVEEDSALDIAPDEPPKSTVLARRDPVVVGAGRTKSLRASLPADMDWSTVGRNDPCPCGSGKKFKKCHGANL
jgi:preprotein translocase subunit SecA